MNSAHQYQHFTWRKGAGGGGGILPVEPAKTLLVSTYLNRYSTLLTTQTACCNGLAKKFDVAPVIGIAKATPWCGQSRSNGEFKAVYFAELVAWDNTREKRTSGLATLLDPMTGCEQEAANGRDDCILEPWKRAPIENHVEAPPH